MSSSIALAQEQAVTAQPTHPAGVRFAEGPANGAQVAIDALKSLPPTPAATPFDPALLQARPPLAMYQVDTRAVAAGGSIESFSPRETWYYVLENSGKAIAGVALKMDGGTLRMRSVNMPGRLLDAIALPLEKLVRDPLLQSGSYEARLLGFAGIYSPGASYVIWLKSDAPGRDLFFVPPLPFLPDTFRANQLYPDAEFLKLLAAIRRKLAISAYAF
jgi:hypothetical protein